MSKRYEKAKAEYNALRRRTSYETMLAELMVKRPDEYAQKYMELQDELETMKEELALAQNKAKVLDALQLEVRE